MTEKEPQEWTDVSTGTRLLIEYDIPQWPRITIFPPKDGAGDIEEINEAISRLLQSSGLHPKPRCET